MDITAAAAWLNEHAAHVIADELARIPPGTAAVAFRMLAKDDALEACLDKALAEVTRRGGNILEIKHNRNTRGVALSSCLVSFELETRDAAQAEMLFNKMAEAGYNPKFEE